jgi:hypothetical protein
MNLFRSLSTLLLLCLLSSSAFAQTPKRVAVFLINFQDDTHQSDTVDFFRFQLFTGASSVRAYYQENTFGKVNLTGALRSDGDIFGWYTIPFNASNCLAQQSQIKQAAQAQAAADGFVAGNYEMLMYFLDPPGPCGGITGTPGNPSIVWYPSGLFSPGAVVHEIGHTFGRMHANALNCFDANGNRVSLSNNCQTVTYGNPFTAMGESGLRGYMSGFEKGNSFENWLEPWNVQTITGNGAYTLAPLEQPSALPLTLRIPRDWQYIYLDFRRTFGFDFLTGSYDGVIVYLGPDFNSESQLLDMTPGTLDFSDAVLATGATFVDSEFGISITTTSIGPSAATVNVSFNPAACVNKQSPVVQIFPFSQSGNAGQTLTYQLTTRNPNMIACGPSTYTVTGKAPAQWTISPAFNVTLAPGAQDVRTFTVTSKSSAHSGDYAFTQKAIDQSNSRVNATGTAHYVVN